MAYNDSGELPASQSTYSLGGYTFELKVQTVHEPGEEDVVSVFAICRGPDGTRETQAVDYPIGTTVENWRVEANETEATVYVTTHGEDYPDVESSTFVTATIGSKDGDTNFRLPYSAITSFGGVIYPISSSAIADEVYVFDHYQNGAYQRSISSNWYHGKSSYTKNGKTVYYAYLSYSMNANTQPFSPAPSISTGDAQLGLYCWYALYGKEYSENREAIVGRFAIDIREADTDSWDEPGSDGPPGTTLNVTVTGATAGSCTGTPADNETVKGYGDGGDGGYGGGGGAGASTVIIYEFATDIAESVQQEAISRGPGTGGPGGKGGKGGDGCILIFY